MTLNVETVLAVAIMLSVFAAMVAVGTSLVLGVGFERLRAGFEVIAKQSGFFSDMLNKLEKKVDAVDNQAVQTSKSMQSLALKVDNMTEQANIFAGSIQQLAAKVGCTDSLPTAEQEPADPLANIRHYFTSDSRNALIAASKEKERKQKNTVRARMHAIAKEMEAPARRQQDPVNDLSRWEGTEACSSIQLH
ncbi:MAG: hypothetical protein OXT65_06765 [Alphaproteobacteria bacterium]|nr:hypothetical protein [Alphaproteobacteria bacterium]